MLFLFLKFSFSLFFFFLAFCCCREREYLPCILVLEFWSARSSSELVVSMWRIKKSYRPYCHCKYVSEGLSLTQLPGGEIKHREMESWESSGHLR